jgi:hypothetical protein
MSGVLDSVSVSFVRARRAKNLEINRPTHYDPAPRISQMPQIRFEVLSISIQQINKEETGYYCRGSPKSFCQKASCS